MLRTAASKVMWVGRATVFLVGLAVILALVLGLASAALAGTGVNGVFNLGVKNTVDAMTQLVSNTGAGPNGPMLRIDNNSTAMGATGLQILTEAGKPPMTANSGARVANLNADKLDNKNSTDFAAAYKRTVVVSPVGTDTQNGQALLNALAAISDASATKKYLLYVEPGTYDLGSGTLQMKEHVDIQGAGELNTLITSAVFSPNCTDNVTAATVMGANAAELRFLTVRNTGTGSGGSCNVAILNLAASPRLTHVMAEATGSQSNVGHIGVINALGSSTTMTDVTAMGSGVANNYGVQNFGASPTIRNSKLNGSSSSLFQHPLTPEGGDNTKVALSQLVGPVTKDGGTLSCFNNYDQNMAAVTCP